MPKELNRTLLCRLLRNQRKLKIKNDVQTLTTVELSSFQAELLLEKYPTITMSFVFFNDRRQKIVQTVHYFEAHQVVQS